MDDNIIPFGIKPTNDNATTDVPKPLKIWLIHLRSGGTTTKTGDLRWSPISLIITQEDEVQAFFPLDVIEYIEYEGYAGA